MNELPQQLLDWANQALQSYEFGAPTLTFLGWNENATFRVIDRATAEQFSLRLHYPRTATFRGLRQRPEAIRSELEWLAALTRDTSIRIPRPVPNPSGSLVTILHPAAGEPLPCTLLRWVNGDVFPEQGALAESAAAALGRLLAALHHHASTWRPPADFVRPSYDASFFQRVANNLQPGVGAGVITAADYQAIQQTIAVCSDMVTSIGRAPETWGLIHNDLHPGNCLIAYGQACPIDFSLCGFGYFLFDIATSFGSLGVALREPLLNAYRAERALPGEVTRQLEACLIMSRLSSYGFALPDPTQHPWLRQRIPQVVATICRPFLDCESFLFTLR